MRSRTSPSYFESSPALALQRAHLTWMEERVHPRIGVWVDWMAAPIRFALGICALLRVVKDGCLQPGPHLVCGAG